MPIDLSAIEATNRTGYPPPLNAAVARGFLAGAPGVVGVDITANGIAKNFPFLPTPYDGKWAHADTARSAGIAGAIVVEDVTVSQSALEVDVLTDPDVLRRLQGAVQALVDFDAEKAAA